jgi:cell wall assembly regulator SMI1/predicted DNA-binding WGR domain protein
MRRFEMRGGGSSKFWEVEVRGKEVVVRFGRIGTDGQTRTKGTASAAAAQLAADRLVSEKVGKGYAEIGAARRGKARAARAVPAKRASGTASIAEVWARIEGWFAKRPELPLRLRPGAKEKDIVAAEKTLGVRFPDDFRASLRLHDGQEDREDGGDVDWLPVALRLGSLASLVRCWQDDRKYYDEEGMAERLDWLDKGERVRQVHLHPKHIPFAGSRYWDYGRLMFDFIPGPQGAAGQVIARDDIDLVFVDASFGAFLERVAIGLERGTRKVYVQG